MFAVTYYCPHCGTLTELERDAYLGDESVAPYPLEGWEYSGPHEEYEERDGVRFVCGREEAPVLSFRPPAGKDADGEAVGCGEPFYLSFVRFEGGEEADPEPPAEYVEIGTGIGPRGPRGPGPGR